MARHRPDRAAFLRDRAGNISLMAAGSSALVIGVLAIGVDYGQLTLQRRSLQSTSNLAAIAAASDVDKAEAAVLAYFELNGKRLGVKVADRVVTPKGALPFSEVEARREVDGYAVIVRGNYSADPSIPPGSRFRANAQPVNAIAVTTTAIGDLFFARTITKEPKITVRSMASQQKLAAFSVGSRAASLNGGVLNKVLGALLGANVSLDVMDYRALIDTDIELFSFTEELAARLQLTGVTYEELLRSKVSLPKLLEAMAGTEGVSPSVSAILSGLSRSLGSTKAEIPLHKLIGLEPFKALAVGESNGLTARLSAFDLLNAAAAVANGGRQVAVDLGATVPGLASIRFDLAIGEPPAGTPFLAVGERGTIVRTAQTRLKVTAAVDGLAVLAGIRISLPLYVEVAHAEAALSEIACKSAAPADASVRIKAAPGLAEIALGNVDASAFNHFASSPRVTRATIVDAALLKVSALGHAYADNMTLDTLSFSPREIREGETKSVATRDTLTSLTTTLLGTLDVDITLPLGLTLGTPKAIEAALASTLAGLTAPLDQVLYNTLLTLGIRIGEADIRVTGVSCGRPVLVQ